MPLPALAAIAGIGTGLQAMQGLFGLGLGVAQLGKARSIRNKRPTYNIPEEYAQREGLRQNLLNSRSTAAKIAEGNINQAQATAINQAQNIAPSSSTALSLLGASQGTADRAFRNLSAQEEGFYDNRLRGLESAQMAMAQQKEKAFDVNEMQPYQEAVQMRSALTQGGLQNVSGSLGQLSGLAGGLFDMEAENQLVSELFKMAGGNRAPKLTPAAAPQQLSMMDMFLNRVNQNPFGTIPQLQPLG